MALQLQEWGTVQDPEPGDSCHSFPQAMVPWMLPCCDCNRLGGDGWFLEPGIDSEMAGQQVGLAAMHRSKKKLPQTKPPLGKRALLHAI